MKRELLTLHGAFDPGIHLSALIPSLNKHLGGSRFVPDPGQCANSKETNSLISNPPRNRSGRSIFEMIIGLCVELCLAPCGREGKGSHTAQGGLQGSRGRQMLILRVGCQVVRDLIDTTPASIMEVSQGLLTRICFHKTFCTLLASYHHQKSLTATLKPTAPGK